MPAAILFAALTVKLWFQESVQHLRHPPPTRSILCRRCQTHRSPSALPPPPELLLATAGSLAPLAANAGPSSAAALPGPDIPVDAAPYHPQVSSWPAPAPRAAAYWGAPTSGDTYQYYETLGVEVRFAEAVTVTGVPYLELLIGQYHSPLSISHRHWR